MQNFGTFFLGLIFAISCSTISSRSYGNAVDPTEKLKALQNQILANAEKEKKIRALIFRANQEIFKLNEEINRQSLQASSLQDETRLVADRILLLSEELSRAQSELRESAIYLRMISNRSERQTFWQDLTPRVRSRQMHLISRLSQHQIGRVEQLQRDQDELELRKGQFVNQRTILARSESYLGKKKAQLEEKRKSQMGQQNLIRAESQKLIQEISQMRAKFQADGFLSSQIRELRQSEISLREFLPERFFERKLRLDWPAWGQIQKSFGPYRVAPNVHFMHKGVWIKPPQKRAKVRAVFQGRVAHLRKINGFGLTLLLDHQDDYYSVYGGFDRVEVEKGAEVLEGQLLGFSADKVYFEIRHFSEPYDPQEWLKVAVNN